MESQADALRPGRNVAEAKMTGKVVSEVKRCRLATGAWRLSFGSQVKGHVREAL